MSITNDKIKELKQLLWILDSKHSVSIPQTQENINYIADEIVKLFAIPDVVGRSEQLHGEQCNNLNTACAKCYQEYLDYKNGKK